MAYSRNCPCPCSVLEATKLNMSWVYRVVVMYLQEKLLVRVQTANAEVEHIREFDYGESATFYYHVSNP